MSDRTNEAIELYLKILKHETLASYYDAKLTRVIHSGDVRMDRYIDITNNAKRETWDITAKPNLGKLEESTVRAYINQALK